MHKVLNYGSALQAYALQHKISELGYDSEIIDYEFPPRKQIRISFSYIFECVFDFLRALIMGFPRKKQMERFQKFYNNHYKLSPMSYNSVTISSDPPNYDVYMTGSDQVWNPKHIGTDTNFLLSFVPEGKTKISYASSFATSMIPDDKKALYAKYLKDYKQISVREPTGVQLVKSLSNKDAIVCCDPVFLLDRKQWDRVAENGQVNIKEKYILVYALYYMFDPYPDLLRIIDHVQKELGFKVYYLNGRKEDAFRPNSSVLKSEGPAEFIQLIKNAEIVITSSFHGVAFSLIYDKPLMAIVRQNDRKDSRITSLLDSIDASHTIFPYDSKCTLLKEELYCLRANRAKLKNIRENSHKYIEESLLQIG